MILAEVSTGASTWNTASASFGLADSPMSARSTVQRAIPPDDVNGTGFTGVHAHPPPACR